MHPTSDVIVTLKRSGKTKTFVMPLAAGKRVEGFIAAQAKPAAVRDSVPARQVLPELADDAMRPATLLRGARYKAGLTQKELAHLLDIRQHHVSEMENGKRPIGKRMAQNLAGVLDCDYRIFI